MRRRLTSVLAVLLILAGLFGAGRSSSTWTLYTPYSSVVESETAFKLSNPTHWMPVGFDWALILIGCLLITLMHAPRRAAIGAGICYACALLAHTAIPRLLQASLLMPRRYHYYYSSDDGVSNLNLLNLASVLLIALGLLLSLVPLVIARLTRHR